MGSGLEAAGGGVAAAILISGLLTGLADGSSGGGLESPSLSAIGLPTFGAVFEPAVNWDSSLAEMMSTATESTDDFSSGFAANEIKPAPRTRACTIADIAQSLLIPRNKIPPSPIQGPCSTSVTRATLRNPAEDSRPITRITVP